ncbi:LptF/LptG family permease [Thermus sp.]|uniref:LptF/LptG family permease n=1 Tax=Thermus sp. TaxID=275 RepID=UPI00261EBE85|nr:LptF/LptG family permease [Thermus sp.]MCX7850355.1 LptF/LptG family permease [Thermus sp.]
MKTLHRYLLRETLPVLLLALLFLTAVYLFGFFYAGARWLEGVPLFKVARWLGYHVPGVLVQVFPIALVTTTVLVFGRLAAEGAQFALLSGGIPLGRAALPLLAVGGVLSGLALYLQEYLVPQYNERVRVAWWDEIHTEGAGLHRLKGLQIPIGQGRSLYFEGFDWQTKEMLRVRIASFQGEEATFLFAERGSWQDKVITLKGYRFYRVDFAAVPALEEAPDLLAGVRRVFRAVSQGSVLEVESDLSRARAIADYADTFSFGQDSLSAAYRKLRDPFLPPLERWRARLEFHSKLALPLANLVLVLLAAGMALRYGRSTGLALGLSVVLALGYYGSFFLGRSLAGLGALPPEVGAWGANLLFLALGVRALR